MLNSAFMRKYSFPFLLRKDIYKESTDDSIRTKLWTQLKLVLKK